MKTLRTIPSLLLVSLSLTIAGFTLSGCSKDDPIEEEVIIPSEPDEEGIMTLMQGVTSTIPLSGISEMAPPGTYSFYLIPEKSNEEGKYPPVIVTGTADEIEKDGTYLHLELPAGTKCMKYVVSHVVTKGPDIKPGQEPIFPIGCEITVRENGSILSNDYYDSDMDMFGHGTSADPYKVSCLYNILNIASRNDETDFESIYFKMIIDIDCAAIPNNTINDNSGGCQPIAFKGKPFKGVFDGNGKTISNMKLRASSETDNFGLFSVIDGSAVVKNLRCKNMQISSAVRNVGAIAGIMRGNATIQNCIVEGSIISGVNSVGGIVGRMEGGTIRECTNQSSKIEGDKSQSNAIGGLIGYISLETAMPSLITLVNNGVISGKENVGGIIGFVAAKSNSTKANPGEKLKLIRLKSHGNMITGHRSVGGIIGGSTASLYLDELHCSSSIRPAENPTEPQKDFGGLVGAVCTNGSLDVVRCTTGYTESGTTVNTSEKMIIGGDHTGGLVGYASSESSIEIHICKTAGNTYGTNFVGGQVGQTPSEIYFGNCLNTGVVDASGSYAGGLLGRSDTKVRFGANQNNGNVTAHQTCAGGFLGNGEDVYIYDGTAINTANVTANKMYAGGFIGYARRCKVSNINQDGTNVISSASRAGGIIGLVGDWGGYFNNITLSCHVNKTDVAGERAGGIAGEASAGKSTFNKCHFNGSVSGTIYVGGIAGYTQNSTFSYCDTKSDNAILCIGTDCTGGIVGQGEHLTISNCVNGTNIRHKAGSGSRMGGIIGQCSYTSIKNCRNEAEVGGSEIDYVGGICGYSEFGTQKLCQNMGKVTGKDQVGGICGLYFGSTHTQSKMINEGTVAGSYRVGGINGFASGTKSEQCCNKALVKGGTNVGGITGEMNSSSGEKPGVGQSDEPYIIQCFNSGKIDGDKAVGGIAGSMESYSWAHIEDSYNRGEVGHNGSEYCAGIVGEIHNTAHAKIHRCYSGGTKRTGWGIYGRALTDASVEVDFFRCHYSSESAPGDSHNETHYTRNSNGGLSDRNNFTDWAFGSVWVMKAWPELSSNRETTN